MTEASPTPLANRRRRSLWGVVAVGLLLLLGGLVLWKFRPSLLLSSRPAAEATVFSPPDDPRLDYRGPFQNIHPSVRYVGDARCAECHADKAATYRRHPMSRSLLPIAELAGQQCYDQRYHNPFDASGVQFFVDRQGDRVWHRQERRDAQGQLLHRLDMEVHYVIGSGKHGYSYVTNRDGYLFQTPISWYSQKQFWDASPGFDAQSFTGRPVRSKCLFCHANRVQIHEGQENHYKTPIFDGHAIGCERCHGPGERHVQAPGRRDPGTAVDYSIVNPRHLGPALREAVCEQCHLTGEARFPRRGRGLYDFRPGLPLEKFWAIFVLPPEPGADSGAEHGKQAVNHVEQMYASRCFQKSAGKLGCISCHDPHLAVEPEQRVAYYRAKCLDCHNDQGCRLSLEARVRQSPQDSCIDCHMPSYPAADIAHAASTNHRIIRRAAAPDQTPLDLNRTMVSFYQDRLDPHDPEFERDLGIALTQWSFRHGSDLLLSEVSPLALLERAVRNCPEDLEAWEAEGGLLMRQRRLSEALAAFEVVLAQSPKRERSLVQAAGLTQSLRRWDAARTYWQRAVAANPWMPAYRRSLALLLAQQKAWTECGPQCEAWMRLDPASAEARGLWIKYLVTQRRMKEAHEELSRLEALHPPFLGELRSWLAWYMMER